MTKEQYEFALTRIEELLPLVTDETPATDRNAVELSMLSEFVIAYEKEHFALTQCSHDALSLQQVLRRQSWNG